MFRTRTFLAGICLLALVGTARADSWRTSVGNRELRVNDHVYDPYDGGASFRGLTSETIVNDMLTVIGSRDTGPSKVWTALQVIDTLVMQRDARPNAETWLKEFDKELGFKLANGDGAGPLAWALNQIMNAGRWTRQAPAPKDLKTAYRILDAQRKSTKKASLHLITAAVRNAEGDYKGAVKPYLIAVSNLLDANGSHTHGKGSAAAWDHMVTYRNYTEYFNQIGTAREIAKEAISSPAFNKSDIEKMQRRILETSGKRGLGRNAFRLPTVSRETYKGLQREVRNARARERYRRRKAEARTAL